MKSQSTPEPEITRHQSTRAALLALAQRLGPGEKLPKFAELRDELNVSGTTLIGVLDELESRGVLIRKHGVGIFVARDVHRHHIALLCDPRFFSDEGLASPFWQHFVQLAWVRAHGNGHHLTLHFVESDQHDVPISSDGAPASLGDMLTSDFRQGRIQGVLGAGLSTCAVLWLTRMKVPLVAFAGYAPHCVVLDEELTAQRAVEALAERGCRKIALWTASPEDSRVQHSFRKTLQNLGLPYIPSLVLGSDGADRRSPLARGEDDAVRVFGPESDPALRPDGIFLGEDTLARGALPALARCGVRVGIDIPVASHSNANSPLLFGFEDGLIRVESDPTRLVDEMYALLLAKLEGRAAPEEMVRLAPIVRLPVLHRSH